MKHKAAILPGSRIIWLQSQYAVTADQSIFIAFQHIQRVASCAPDARPIIFFFSSRRRHTRSLRDWSSDVCSSDLGDPRRTRTILSCCPATFALGSGSEERRVGKECRCRWSPYHQKKKQILLTI